MPDISISESQRERLRAVQEALESETPYGHVRPRDALEYLLDEYESRGGLDTLEATPAGDRGTTRTDDAGTGGGPSAAGAETTAEPDFEASDGQGDGPTVTRVDNTAVSANAAQDSTDAAAAEGDDGSNADTDEVDEADTGDTDDTDDTDEADEADEADTDDTDEDGAGGVEPVEAGGDDSMLNSMMSLLDDNADKWSESSGGEEKYVVELPDGTSEPARTKDDVRALLFKHYR